MLRGSHFIKYFPRLRHQLFQLTLVFMQGANFFFMMRLQVIPAAVYEKVNRVFHGKSVQGVGSGETVISLQEDQAVCTLTGDIACSRPTEPKPRAHTSALWHTDVVDGPSKATGTRHPQKPIICSSCKGEGHTERTCSLKKQHNTLFSSFQAVTYYPCHC